MPVTLILGRHGQTTFNRDGLVMGRSDSPLTPHGIRTAERIARFLETKGIERIFSSPLGRAAATAGIYADHLGIAVNQRDSMAELSCGSWEGRPRSEVTVDHRFLRPTWETTPPGGESCADGDIRLAPFIEELRLVCAPSDTAMSGNKAHAGSWDDRHQKEPPAPANQAPIQPHANNKDSSILVVGHASINRVFLKLWLDLSPESALRISCPHDTVYVLGTDKSVAAWNCDGKLTDELLLEEM